MSDWLVHCRRFLIGGGQVQAASGVTRLVLPPILSKQYADAQFDDYAGQRRRQYRHNPPLRLRLRARFSQGPLIGTAGFGFWNNPFGPQSKIPAPPQAIWFFYASPPSDMPLALDVPGFGWKAACIDAGRASALACAPFAPPVVLACRSERLYRAIWPRVQRALAIGEKLIDPESMADWHAYELEWRRDGARWRVDGTTVLETDRSPRGSLGFVAWIDNQYAIVTPQGRLGGGVLQVRGEQWLELNEVEIE